MKEGDHPPISAPINDFYGLMATRTEPGVGCDSGPGLPNTTLLSPASESCQSKKIPISQGHWGIEQLNEKTSTASCLALGGGGGGRGSCHFQMHWKRTTRGTGGISSCRVTPCPPRMGTEDQAEPQRLDPQAQNLRQLTWQLVGCLVPSLGPTALLTLGVGQRGATTKWQGLTQAAPSRTPRAESSPDAGARGGQGALGWPSVEHGLLGSSL